MVLTKTHKNRIFIGSLVNTDYDPIGKNLPCFENVIMFTNIHGHKSRCTPAKFRPEKTWHPFFYTLTSKIVSQIFGKCVNLFLQGDKVRKGKRIKLPAKRRHNILIRGIIRIRRHGFVGKRSDNILSH